MTFLCILLVYFFLVFLFLPGEHECHEVRYVRPEPRDYEVLREESMRAKKVPWELNPPRTRH